jgi:hypothetical protein
VSSHDAWSRLTCADWLPQDRTFGWSGVLVQRRAWPRSNLSRFGCSIVSGRVAPRAAVPRLLDPNGRFGRPVQSGITAIDQHQPAARGRPDVGDHRPFPAQIQVDPPRVQMLVAGMPASPGSGRCLLPATLQYHARVEGAAVMPGGLDQQPPHVRVARLDDRALDPALPGGVFAGHRPEVGSGEPVPVADLHRERETGKCRDAAQTPQPSCQRGELAVSGQRRYLLVAPGPARRWSARPSRTHCRRLPGTPRNRRAAGATNGRASQSTPCRRNRQSHVAAAVSTPNAVTA